MTARIIRGNALDLPLADNSVDLICTSPPYFGLRSYQDGGEHYAGQLGSEPTPAEFVAALVAATREMVRVLKPSGSIFVNLGDKYAGQSGSSGSAASAQVPHIPSHPSPSSVGAPQMRQGGLTSSSTGPLPGMKQGARDGNRRSRPSAVDGIPGKSLMLIPERYRIACVDELGLIARAVIVWDKPNGLPESVRDRVRRSHEDWVHFTKEPRYYSAVDEVREPQDPRNARPNAANRDGIEGEVHRFGSTSGMRNGDARQNPLGKLPGSVWRIATQPLTVPASLGIDHFAAFPMEWPRRIIKGWSPREVCTACGQGRAPVVETDLGVKEQVKPAYSEVAGVNGSARHGRGASTLGSRGSTAVITGYDCACPDTTAPTTPGVVLDPFGGTGTTALVASVLGRQGISVDMSADYCRLATWRTTDRGQIASAMQVEKPEPVDEAQYGLFGDAA